MLELVLDRHVEVHRNGVQLLASRGLLYELHLVFHGHQIRLLLLLLQQLLLKVLLLLLLLLLLLRHAPLLDHAVLLPLVYVQGLLAGAHLAADVALELDPVDDQMPGSAIGPH